MDMLMLQSSAEPLAERYDVALLDLDGVVYVGGDAVRHAPEALAQAREHGMRLAFVTNNAARPPQEVAHHLTELGIPADPLEVITSAQAAAHYLAERLPADAPVLVVGTVGLVEALRERGLTPVLSAEQSPAAVVQGYSPTLNWAQLAEGAVAIRRGVPWVATNVDPTVPSPRGPLPGNGSLVAALRLATGARPIVTGKPDPTMHRETVERTAAERPIVVGDRLDTDIEGANAVGCDSLLVLSGVTTGRDLIRAEPRHRPTFIGSDLRSLLGPHPGVTIDGRTGRCGDWVATSDEGKLRLACTTTDHAANSVQGDQPPETAIDALRALCTAWWDHADSGADAAQLSIDADDQRSAEVLHQLALA